jgi:hypothetical protein
VDVGLVLRASTMDKTGAKIFWISDDIRWYQMLLLHDFTTESWNRDQNHSWNTPYAVVYMLGETWDVHEPWALGLSNVLIHD